MFDPAQLARLNKAIDEDPELSIFEGFHIRRRRIEVGVAEAGGGPFEVDPTEVYKPERVFGDPIRPACMAGIADRSIDVPAPRLLRASNAVVVGYTGVIDSDGRLFMPDLLSAANLDLFVKVNSAGRHGFVARDYQGQLTGYFGSRAEPRRFKQSAFFMPNIEPGNFGSFLLRSIAHIQALQQMDVAFDCYIATDRSPWIWQAIEIFGLPRKPLFTVREVNGDIFENLFVFNDLYREGVISGRVLRMFDVASRLPGSGSGSKIYISRSSSGLWRPWYRVMRNECDVEAELSRLGFSIVYPETLSLSEQMALFRGATHVIGPSGSGMLNAMFSMPDVRVVDIETDTNSVRQHSKLYSSTKKVYSFLFCRPDCDERRPMHQWPYNVDDRLLRESVEWLLA